MNIANIDIHIGNFYSNNNKKTKHRNSKGNKLFSVKTNVSDIYFESITQD